ncbi:pseudaminic acid synthase [Paracoccaceae bacterium]|nr:pseudaminic acid synthase [Paracoccaceae bacterium]
MFEIDGRKIGNSFPPYIIAEISANHNGKIDNAFKIIDMAQRAGANAIKMQTYTPDTITLKSTEPDFQIKEGLWAGTTLYELYEKAFTPWEWHKELFDYAKAKNISIFSTPFDFSAIELLESLNTPAYKIASFECIDLPLIRVAASTGKPLVISTGMADQREIQDAVDTALKYGNGDLTLLHCISGYPAPADNYNLHTIKDMKSRFGVDVGLSDHTIDNTTAIAAVALGAVMVEKHVTLDRNGGGPDDSFSLEEDGLTELCSLTKIAWKSLGQVNYERTEAEKGNVKFRRSLYYVRPLQKGDTITENDIKSVRPGFGLPPKYYDKLIGSKVTMSVKKNSPVTLDSVNPELD